MNLPPNGRNITRSFFELGGAAEVPSPKISFSRREGRGEVFAKNKKHLHPPWF